MVIKLDGNTCHNCVREAPSYSINPPSVFNWIRDSLDDQGILGVTSKENGSQTEDSFLEFAKHWLPLVGATRENPAIVVLDAHVSHLSNAFIKLCMKHYVIAVAEPSYMSILLQAADNGVNCFLEKAYCKAYSVKFSLVNGEMSMDL